MNNRSLLGILEVRLAEGSQDELPIYRTALAVGRSQGNDIILDDPTVSSQHAQVSLGHAGWLVSDINSSNGTFLDGQRLTPG